MMRKENMIWEYFAEDAPFFYQETYFPPKKVKLFKGNYRTPTGEYAFLLQTNTERCFYFFFGEKYCLQLRLVSRLELL